MADPRRELKKLCKSLGMTGITFEQGKKHLKLRANELDGFYTTSLSASDVRALKNIKADLKRLIK